MSKSKPEGPERDVLVMKYRSTVYSGIAVASGILLALSFPHPSIGLLAWVALVPFLFVLSGSGSIRNSLAYGLLFGFTFFAIVLYWIQVFGYLAWVSLSLMLSLWIALFAVVAWWILCSFNPAGRLITIPVLWGLIEYGRALGPWGFGWANIGSTVENIRLASIASYAGEIGLGSVIVFSNVLLFESIRVISKGIKERHISRFKSLKSLSAVILTLLLFLLAYMSGIQPGDISNKKDTAGEKSISVAIIQPNIPQYLKIENDNNDRIKAVYRDMTKGVFGKEGGFKPDLVIWPESVLIAYADDEKPFYDEIISMATREKSAFLYGTLSRDTGNAVYNNAVYVDANRGVSNYRKIHLVPFGEYVPARRLVERMNTMANLVVDKTPGTDYSVFDFNNTPVDEGGTTKERISNERFSPVICFESADSRLVGNMVRKGSRMIFVLTNDGWFGNSAELEQHFRISRMRAIEYGVPVVQAANTGVSGIIDSSGGIIRRAATNKRIVLKGSVSFAEKPGKYTIFGPWLPYVYCLVLTAAITIFIKGSRSSGVEVRPSRL